MERLQKYLARAGIASRRHAEELISSGHVTVNNQRITELGTKVEPGKDLVAVDGKLVAFEEKRSYYLLYKPPGVVTTLSDPQGRPTVKDLVPAHIRQRIFPVGRLDYDAEGALMLTDDGELANRLTHPKFNVARTYLAKVKGVPTEATLEKLRGGVRLEDGPARPLSVDVFENAEKNTWIVLVVGEGRPHLIKRLCAAVGHPVVRLFRPYQAGIGVEGLRPGQMRALTADEVRRVQEISEGKPAQSPALRLPARRHGRAGASGASPMGSEASEADGPDDTDLDPRGKRRAPPPWQVPGAPSASRSAAGRTAAPGQDRPGRAAWTDRFGAPRADRASSDPRSGSRGGKPSGAPARKSSDRPAERASPPRGSGGRPTASRPGEGRAGEGRGGPEPRQQGRFERSATKKTFSRERGPGGSGAAPRDGAVKRRPAPRTKPRR